MVKGRFRDLTGQRFNKLTVISRAENIGREVVWNCLCECGNEKIVRTKDLIHTGIKSCGCIRKQIKDYTGQKIGVWNVLEYAGKTKSNNSKWLCQCSCEIPYKRIITDSELKKNKNCKCKNKKSRTHGKSRSSDKMDTKLYRAWISMRNRCSNVNHKEYKHYGARGISVCNEWDNLHDGLMNFYNWSIENGVKEGLSIDRIDVNGNYEPSNCRWVDYTVQNNNKTDNNYITYEGETLTVTQWTRKLNVTYMIFSSRYKKIGNYQDTIKYFIKENEDASI